MQARFDASASARRFLRARRMALCIGTLFGVAVASPAVALVAGDLVTICWNSDGDDDFALIALANIPAGTRLFLGDNGWSANSNDIAPESQSPLWTRQIQFDITSAIPFGTVIEFDQAGTNAVLVNPSFGTLTMVTRHTPTTSVNNNLSFGTAGDQLLVWQTAGNTVTGAATVISGFNGSVYTNPGLITITNGWQVGLVPQSGQTGATSESNLPAGLIAYDGTNAATATALGLASYTVSGVTGVDNYKYTGSVSLGTKSAFLTSINNPANWQANDTTPFGCAFGAGAFPEIAVTGNSVNIADGDSTPSVSDHTDFGNADTSTQTVVRTFTINNSGSASLTVGTVTIAGTNAGDFSVNQPPAGTVAPLGSTTFQVTFNPSATGLRTASLSFSNNDSDENPFDFSIQGTGTAPEIAVSGNGTNIADGDNTPSVSDDTDFGSTGVSGGTVAHTFTIANTGTGTGTLVLGNVNISGTNAADFSVTAAPNGPVSAGTSTTFQLTFNPSAVGVRTATVTFSNSDSDEDPFDFAVQGFGISADIQVSKTDFQSVLQPGVDTLYTIQVRNAGPSAVASVHIVDNLPGANLTNAQWTCTSTPSGLCPAANGSGNIDQNTAPLASGNLLQYQLIATPAGSAGTLVTNTATATTAANLDPDGSNNSASDSDTIVTDAIFIDGFE